MYAIIICNLLNIFLNYVFLTGSFNMPNLGVKGTATATLAVSILEMILIIIFATRDKLVKLSLRFRREYFSLNDVKKVAILGIPGGIFAFSESAAFSVAGFFASSISVYDIAAHQMLVWIVNSLLVPIFGFSVAVTARIAYNYADGKKALAFKVGVYALILTAIYAFTMLILLVIFDAQIMSALLKGEKGDIVTINLILSAIIILLFSEIFDGVQIMGGAVLRGYQDTIFPLIFAIISYWFICIPLSYYFGIIKEMGVFGIWLGLGIGVTFQAFLISTRFILKFKP
jgi:MATE family multidrug resistance protein